MDRKGINNNFYGKKHTEESKEKMREARKLMKERLGYLVSKEAREKISKANKDVPKSEEHKRKVGLANSIALKGRKQPEKFKQKMRDIAKDNPNFGNKGRKFSEEHKKKISKSKIGKKMGEENPSWLGGKSFEPYGVEFNKRFKNEIRKRDNQVCMNCGMHREKLPRALNVHHINYDKLLSIKENCISLCNCCHSLTNTNREYWIKLFQEKLDKLYGYKYSKEGLPIIELEIGGNQN